VSLYAKAYRLVARPTDLRALQKELGVEPDGIYGPKTHKAHLAVLDTLWAAVCFESGWIYTGTAVPMTRPSVRLKGQTLSHLRRIVLHWPVTPDGGALAMDNHWARNLARGSVVCSNVSVDEHTVVWHAGPHRPTNHAPGVNAESIGVDIAVPVLASRAEAAKARGLFCGYGGRKNDLLLLSPTVAKRVGTLLDRTESVLQLSLERTDHAAVDHLAPNGGRGKIDCVIWRDVLREVDAIRP